MAANPDQYRLSEAENQAVFEQEIKPWIFGRAKSVQNPVAVIFGGQPGAGKSALVKAAKSELEPRGGAAEIVGDDLREFHPLNEWLMQRDDKTAAFYTQRDISSWIEKAIAEAKSQQAAQREAGLKAAVEQMRQQIEAQQAEAKHLHQALADAGAKLEALGERERGYIEQAAKAKAEAERLADQLKEQKAQSLEVTAKLEGDLSAARKDARDSAERLGRASGELEALRAQAVRRQTQAEKDKPSARISS